MKCKKNSTIMYKCLIYYSILEKLDNTKNSCYNILLVSKKKILAKYFFG